MEACALDARVSTGRRRWPSLAPVSVAGLVAAGAVAVHPTAAEELVTMREPVSD